MSLESVAEATRIATRHLLALERSDLAALPAAPFTKGYIRAYAQFLGIDPQPMLNAYRYEQRRRGVDTPEAQAKMLAELSRLVEHRAPKTGLGGFLTQPKRLALVLAAACLLGGAGWLVSRAWAPHAVATAPRPQADASTEVVGAPEATPVDTPTPQETVALSSRETPQPSPRAVATAAASAPAASGTTPVLQVSHSGVGTGITGHRLVGSADRFVEGTRVAFWTRVLGGKPGEEIRHVWLREGQVVMRAELTLGGSHWRTYSRRLLGEGSAGRWAVEARGPDGELLARQEFLCVPGGG